MADRTKRRIWLGLAALCIAALPCANSTVSTAAEQPDAAASSSIPVALDARLAGDAKRTRFVLDLDSKVQLRAFTLADPPLPSSPNLPWWLLPAGGGGLGLLLALVLAATVPPRRRQA